MKLRAGWDFELSNVTICILIAFGLWLLVRSQLAPTLFR